MTIALHTVDVVVADVARAVAFYRAVGLEAPEGAEAEVQVQLTAPGGGAVLGLMSEAMVRRAMPEWVAPIGQCVTFALRLDDPAAVDATYARVTDAGHAGRKAPWDAFWGQRYAFLEDPDGNRVDLFAALPGREG